MTLQFAGIQLSITRVARPEERQDKAERELQWQRLAGHMERLRIEALARAEIDGVRNYLR